MRVTLYLTAEFRYTIASDWTVRDRSITWVWAFAKYQVAPQWGF